MDKVEHDTICYLGGAGGAGFIYLVIRKILDEIGRDPMKIFWSGASIGASFAAANSIGMTYEETWEKIRENPQLIDHVMNPTQQEKRDARRRKREGVVNPYKLEMIAEKSFGDLTMGEIPNLDIIVTDVTDTEDIHDYTQRKPVEVNYKTFPKLSVKKAIAASETLFPRFYPYHLNYQGRDMIWIDGGQSHTNLINRIVPVGYSGKIISIDPMYHFNNTALASLLRRGGFLEKNGFQPEPRREGLNVAEILPEIRGRSFLETSLRNIEYLDRIGESELGEMRAYL